MRYYILRNGKKYGPATTAQLADLLSKQKISVHSEVLSEDRRVKCQIGEIPEFSADTEDEETGITQVEDEIETAPGVLEPRKPTQSHPRTTLSLNAILTKADQVTATLRKQARPRLKKFQTFLREYGISGKEAALVGGGLGLLLLLLLIAAATRHSPSNISDPTLSDGTRVHFVAASPEVWAGLNVNQGKTIQVEGVVSKRAPGGVWILIRRTENK